MKNTIILFLIVLLPLTAAGRHSPSIASGSNRGSVSSQTSQIDVCSPNDTITEITIGVLGSFLSETGPISVSIRDSFGLSAGTASGIVLVSDTAVCRRVRRKLDSLVALPVADTTRRVFIAKVDSMFVVNDLVSARLSVRGAFIVISPSYAYVGAWR